MRFGFDFAGTISRNPQLFGTLTSSLISEGNEVFIFCVVSRKVNPEKAIHQIRKTKVPNTDIFILTWENSEDEDGELKLEMCEKLNIHTFFDDDKKICDLLSLNGIHSFNYNKYMIKPGKKIDVKVKS
jgi:hypothetical protein